MSQSQSANGGTGTSGLVDIVEGVFTHYVGNRDTAESRGATSTITKYRSGMKPYLENIDITSQTKRYPNLVKYPCNTVKLTS